MEIVAIGVGGFVGAILRYLVGEYIPVANGFPYATLLVNLIGCLLLAYFLTIIDQKGKLHPRFKLAIGTGLIGSFTTFSTFSVETLHLFQNGQFVAAASYILFTILGGIILAVLGVKLATLINEPNFN